MIDRRTNHYIKTLTDQINDKWSHLLTKPLTQKQVREIANNVMKTVCYLMTQRIDINLDGKLSLKQEHFKYIPAKRTKYHWKDFNNPPIKK